MLPKKIPRKKLKKTCNKFFLSHRWHLPISAVEGCWSTAAGPMRADLLDPRASPPGRDQASNVCSPADRKWLYMGVSKNNGTPKSSILIGFSIINHPFWGFSPYFLETPIYSNPQEWAP